VANNTADMIVDKISKAPNLSEVKTNSELPEYDPRVSGKGQFTPELTAISHPTDICWSNVRSGTNTQVLMKLLLTLLAIIVLIFLTTPASMINLVLRDNEAKDATNLEWVDRLPDSLKYLFRSLAPTLLVIAINELLILIISSIVDMEKHHRFSTHQGRLLSLLFVYLLMNMLIVPGLAASAVTNLFDIIHLGAQNGIKIFKQLFSLQSGDFFLLLVIGNSGGPFLSAMNNFGDLFMSYLDPKILVKTKVIEKEAEFLHKNHASVYTYGTTYSFFLVILSIGVVFQ